MTKTIPNPEIIKELVKRSSKNNTQTINDHSTSIDIETIGSYPLSTEV